MNSRHSQLQDRQMQEPKDKTMDIQPGTKASNPPNPGQTLTAQSEYSLDLTSQVEEVNLLKTLKDQNPEEVKPSLLVMEGNAPLSEEPIRCFEKKSMDGYFEKKSMGTGLTKIPTLLMRFGLPGANRKQPCVSIKPNADQSVAETQSEFLMTAQPQSAVMNKPKDEVLEVQCDIRSKDVSTGLMFHDAADTSGCAAASQQIIPKPDEMLVREKASLMKELEQMKELLRNQKAKSDQQVQHLQTELLQKKQAERQTALKVKTLEEALSNERRKKREIQSILAKKEEHLASLTRRMKHLEKEHFKWEEERSCLIAAHQKEISKLTKSWIDTFEKNKSRWQEEKACLVAEHTGTISRIRKMWKQDLEINRSQWEEERCCLQASHEEETFMLTKSWIDTMENSRSQWKEEKSCLIAQHQKTTSRMKEIWKQELENCRSQWKEEKSHLITEHLKVQRKEEQRAQEDHDRERAQWHEKSHLQESIRAIMVDKEQAAEQKNSVIKLNGYNYARGGCNGKTPFSAADCSSSENNQCSLPMNRQRSEGNYMPLNNKVYICGGFIGTKFLQTSEYYNPETNLWTVVTSMNSRSIGNGVIAYSNHVYTLGGYGNKVLQNAEAYNPKSKAWQADSSIFTLCSNFGIEVIDGLFVVAGFNGGTTTYNLENCHKTMNMWFDAGHLEILCRSLSGYVVPTFSNRMAYTFQHNSLPTFSFA